MESSGLILFHGDVNEDYVAIELAGGVLKTTLQIGEYLVSHYTKKLISSGMFSKKSCLSLASLA